MNDKGRYRQQRAMAISKAQPLSKMSVFAQAVRESVGNSIPLK
jgi:hypothetical protein